MSAVPGGRRPLRRVIPFTLLLAVAVLGSAAAGCTVETPADPSPSPDSAASPSPTSSSDPSEPDPVLVPGGTADDNLPYFDLINGRFLQADPMPGGRPIIDNLVAAGFDKTAMQVTADSTAIGRDADAVEFSVQIGERCLIGQASGTGYASTVGAVVPGTGCLIGLTRAIDW